MEKNLTGKKPNFRSNAAKVNSYRLLALLILVLVGVFVLRALGDKQIRSPFEATPIPTRTANSFVTEAEARFKAGDLNGSIAAYKQATQLEPQNVQLWSNMAQIQVYSSNMLTTDDEKRTRLQEALASINKAVAVTPDDSTAHAIRAFVLDWNSNATLAGDQSENLLAQAEQEAVQALQLDNQNTLALAYYAEILLDQQKWNQASQYIAQAIERDPSLMDVHRVNAIVMETFRDYNGAIQEYEKAAEITPNLTFLYISIGTNYRYLKQYDRALEYFDKAAKIDAQLQIKDPIPYVAIGKTYTQTGDFL